MCISLERWDIVKILLLNNNFYGSYVSNQYFYSELVDACQELGVACTFVSCLEDAITAIERQDISFSLCLGVFPYRLQGKPLYDLYNLPHYQWLSDNPLKFHLDHQSINITYIFIDKQFSNTAGTLQQNPLILPLGYSKKKKQPFSSKKVNAILFPGQIRNLQSIRQQIKKSVYRKEILEFIEPYNYDTSYIQKLQTFTQGFSADKKIEIFRLTNSYLRTNKRIQAINSIHTLPVYIAGENYENPEISENKNIRFIGKYDYFEIEKQMNRYRYVLNIDPNYHATIHERISRGINAGSISISNWNDVVNPDGGFSMAFRFDGTIPIDELIERATSDLSELHRQQIGFIRELSWKNSLERILYDFTQNKRGRLD